MLDRERQRRDACLRHARPLRQPRDQLVVELAVQSPREMLVDDIGRDAERAETLAPDEVAERDVTRVELAP